MRGSQPLEAPSDPNLGLHGVVENGQLEPFGIGHDAGQEKASKLWSPAAKATLRFHRDVLTN